MRIQQGPFAQPVQAENLNHAQFESTMDMSR